MITSVKELFTAPYDQDKADFLRGNYDLAAHIVFDWYRDQADYIAYRDAFSSEKSDEGRMHIYLAELEEVKEAKELHWEKVLQERDWTKPWEDDPLVNEMWAIASECADVVIVGASILRNRGWESSQVAKLWVGEMELAHEDAWAKKYQADIEIVKQDMSELGIDFAESVMNKMLLNEEHYSASLLPWVLVLPIQGDGDKSDDFGRALRKNVGDTSSQMPDMNMHPILGEMLLGRKIHKSPFGSNGNSPVAIIFEQEKVMVAESDRDKDYGLYRMSA